MPPAIDKVPPHSNEAEQSFLGALLLDKDAIIKVGDAVQPDDFYRDIHRMVYEAMLDLFKRREPIDLLSLATKLDERKQLELVGGRAYLITLSNSVPTAANIAHYADIVVKKATLRKLIAAATDIAGSGFQEGEEVSKLLDTAEQKLFAISQKHTKQSFVPMSTVLESAFDRIDELHREKGKLRGISTGYASLDSILGGLQRSDLVILAARPSVGKTSFAMDMARFAATRNKVAVGVISLEMSKEQLVDRMICSEANVDLWRMRTGRLSEGGGSDDFARIDHALGVLSEAPIWIDDSPSSSIMEIRTKARRLQMEHGLGLIIVDYLQLMESKGKIENRVLEISEITRSLKGLARELNVPVVALSQLARAVEMSKPAIPKLAHLRESGSIEQDADVVMFIYRKAADKNYRIEDIPMDERNIAEIHVAKHRNGPTGVVRLYFDETRASFKNLDRSYNAPPAMGE
jgi:replicative DNA helicase